MSAREEWEYLQSMNAEVQESVSVELESGYVAAYKRYDSMMDSSFITSREEAIDYYSDYQDAGERVDTYMPSSYVPAQKDLTSGHEDVEVVLPSLTDIVNGIIENSKNSVPSGSAGMAYNYEKEHGYYLEGAPRPLWDEHEVAVTDDEDMVITDEDGEAVTRKSGGVADDVVVSVKDDIDNAIADIEVPLDFKIGGIMVLVIVLGIAVIAVAT